MAALLGRRGLKRTVCNPLEPRAGGGCPAKKTTRSLDSGLGLSIFRLPLPTGLPRGGAGGVADGSLKTEQKREEDAPVRGMVEQRCAAIVTAGGFVRDLNKEVQPGRSPGVASSKSRARGAAFLRGCRVACDDSTGEFDPGSERTLAACLTHASRARRGASVPWRAAHG